MNIFSSKIGNKVKNVSHRPLVRDGRNSPAAQKKMIYVIKEFKYQLFNSKYN